ncbi:MAG: hypothetical protein EOP04_00120 [Proteobacteria bacterium]|nr:MAG: hypothetical protein EOP04_00120 [Pseudomonadota bacterium]
MLLFVHPKNSEIKKPLEPKARRASLFVSGAPSQTWTGTPLREQDFLTIYSFHCRCLGEWDTFIFDKNENDAINF